MTGQKMVKLLAAIPMPKTTISIAVDMPWKGCGDDGGNKQENVKEWIGGRGKKEKRSGGYGIPESEEGGVRSAQGKRLAGQAERPKYTPIYM